MERITAWVLAHRWIAIAGFVAFISIYLLFTELMPRAVSTYVLFGTWRQQEARIASVNNWEVEQVRLSAQKRRLQQHFVDLYVSLPKSDHMSIILHELRESARAESITSKEVRPTERMTFPHYDELPLQVTLQGPFHDLVAFIQRIEQSSYVIKVKQLSFERMASTGAMLTATLSLSVIILKEQQAGR